MTETKLRLKAGYGYWQTDHYPIGGAFRRTSDEGKDIARIVRTFPNYKGVDTEVQFMDGTHGAVRREHCEEL